jgi:uncharacterized protein (TIGR00730 family)
MRRLCVFCGSSTGNRPAYADSARELGAIMAARGIELVFGAGHIGLMGVLADAVLSADGRAVGVIPQALVDKELAHGQLSELHIVDTMHQRKALMADRADAFVALPGGFGTCDEFFEILTWAQLGIHGKPIGLLNVAGFFDPLLAWVARAQADGFIRSEDRRLILVAENPGQLLDDLQNYQPSARPTKWADDETR